jgi:phosphatidylinositol alpha-1,6-mannosyltransferase
MRILYLSPGCFDKGGISRYNRYQIRAFRELYGSDQVAVLSLAGPKEGDFEEAFTVNWFGSGPGLISSVRFVLVYVWKLFVWSPKVVWVAHVNFSGVALLIARLFKIPVVLNVYGLEVWSGLKVLPSWGLKHVPFIVSDCHYTANWLVEHNLTKVERISVIWDCVDHDRFYPASPRSEVLQKYRLPDPHNHPIILTLGRMSSGAAHKGYDRLVRVFAMIHKAFPKVRLVLAGKGDLIPELKSLCLQLGVVEKVIFTGMVDEAHLVDLYRSATVFSLVSDRGKGRGEGIPLTPLEAMACGVPIIVGNQDGSQEAVFEERNGYVINPFDLDSHAEKLSLLLSDLGSYSKVKQGALIASKSSFGFSTFKIKHQVVISKL